MKGIQKFKFSPTFSIEKKFFHSTTITEKRFRQWPRISPKEWPALFKKKEYEDRMKINNVIRDDYCLKLTRAEDRGDYESVLRYWEELEKIHDITPSNNNYNTIISIFSRKGIKKKSFQNQVFNN